MKKDKNVVLGKNVKNKFKEQIMFNTTNKKQYQFSTKKTRKNDGSSKKVLLVGDGEPRNWSVWEWEKRPWEKNHATTKCQNILIITKILYLHSNFLPVIMMVAILLKWRQFFKEDKSM